jgi:hypothetical protein
MAYFKPLSNISCDEGCFKNISKEAFANAFVKPLNPGRLPSENPKALSLKEGYFCGMSEFYEYMVRGTPPRGKELGHSAETPKRVSTFVDCSSKALIFKLIILEALTRTETKTPTKCQE